MKAKVVISIETDENNKSQELPGFYYDKELGLYIPIKEKTPNSL